MKITAIAPDLECFKQAARAISGIALKTPLIRSDPFSRLAGQDVLLKLETLQPTGAFKIRGAANALARLDAAARRVGIGCCSTGNHGRAIAFAAARMSIRATVCLSALVPAIKVRAIEELGAQVIRIGASQDDAQAETDRLVARGDLVNIPPFDHPDVIAGQGTIALELLTDRPDLASIVVPLSGGGLISGIALAAKALKPDIRIIGVSMTNGAAMHASLQAGRPVTVTEVTSLADSLGGGIGLHNQLTFDICRALVDQIVLLSEAEIYRGMRVLFHDHRLVSEGAGAVCPAALLAGKLALSGPTALIISGQNVDADQFLAVAAGRPVRIGDQTITE
jgi:threonine dehydratase